MRIKYSIVIIASTVLISYLHYSTIPEVHALHSIYAELYYIPILIGALVFGLKGAILAYLFVSALYLPYIFMAWTANILSLAEKILHILFSGIFAILAGFLVDREKRHRKQSEKDRYLAGLGQAATTIVHDLKNPLITILGYARRIREGKGNIETSAQTITESGQSMQKIVNDVLDFAKPVQLTLKEEDLRDVINNACGSCKAKAEELGVTLSPDLPTDPINFMMDGFRLERALVNLINNAIDASNRGQYVTISAIADNNYPIIRIKDHGSGLDAKALENIFIPFYTRKASGTGLGMAIAKKIIEEHKGKIHINSQLGLGTEVWIELRHGVTEKAE
jgi:signal transduction histidine kinase